MSSLLPHTRNTRPLRPGSLRYVRSDAPLDLDEADVRWLLDHDLRTLVDLRSPAEVAARPCPLAGRPEFRYLNCPVTDRFALPQSREEVARSYRSMVDEALWEIIRVIEEAETNVLYFCTAGKDRTGVVSALLLARMGVPRAEIVADYLLSGDNLRPSLEALAAREPRARLEVILPRPEYIDGLLDELGL